LQAHGHYAAVLCCAVLCCAVLCCAVLCCAVLCRTGEATWSLMQTHACPPCPPPPSTATPAPLLSATCVPWPATSFPPTWTWIPTRAWALPPPPSLPHSIHVFACHRHLGLHPLDHATLLWCHPRRYGAGCDCDDTDPASHPGVVLTDGFGARPGVCAGVFAYATGSNVGATTEALEPAVPNTIAPYNTLWARFLLKKTATVTVCVCVCRGGVGPCSQTWHAHRVSPETLLPPPPPTHNACMQMSTKGSRSSARSSLDTTLAVYSGSAINTLVLVASNNDCAWVGAVLLVIGSMLRPNLRVGAWMAVAAPCPLPPPIRLGSFPKLHAAAVADHDYGGNDGTGVVTMRLAVVGPVAPGLAFAGPSSGSTYSCVTFAAAANEQYSVQVCFVPTRAAAEAAASCSYCGSIGPLVPLWLGFGQCRWAAA
jgi:hypothetical protein